MNGLMEQNYDNLQTNWLYSNELPYLPVYKSTFFDQKST